MKKYVYIFLLLTVLSGILAGSLFFFRADENNDTNDIEKMRLGKIAEPLRTQPDLENLHMVISGLYLEYSFFML